MKGNYFLAFLFACVLLMFACLSAVTSGTIDKTAQNALSDTTTVVEQPKKVFVTASNGREFEVITIDSCEYLYRMDAGHGYGFAYQSEVLEHKGNCKYCQKRKNK